MQAGRLRDRVQVLNPVASRLPSGQIAETWEAGKILWAEVKGISGRELLDSGAETTEATIRIWTRFRRDIQSTSRLNVLTGALRGRTLNVIGPPIPDARCTRLEILCKHGSEK